MKEMLSPVQALELVLSRITSLKSEEVELLKGSGRILAETIVARDSLPPFRRSAMDGYAVRSMDTWNQRLVALRVLEELPAGRVSSRALEEGTCIMLMTGAPLPEGADAVVRREEVDSDGELAIIPGQVVAGTNVDRAGSDIQAGDKLLEPGVVLGPGEVAVLAAQGYARIRVYRRPRVAVVTSGDELLEITEQLAPGKIRNSNCYMLAAAVEEAGGKPVIGPPLLDDLEATKARLLQAGEEADLVLSTGGVSMGNYDLVRQALFEIADEVLFWKIQIKPGMPVVAVTKGGKLYLGLSGKPNGALLNFYLLAAPVLAKLAGRVNYHWPRVKAELQNEFPKSSPARNRYLWANAGFDGSWKVMWQQGRELSSLCGFNSLIEIPAETGPLAEGEQVNVILLKGWN